VCLVEELSRPRPIVLLDGDPGQAAEAVGHRGWRLLRACQRQACLIVATRRRELALCRREDGDLPVTPRPQPRRRVARPRQHLLQPTASLAQRAARPPEGGEPDRQPQPLFGLAARGGPVERGPEVVLLALHHGAPDRRAGLLAADLSAPAPYVEPARVPH